MTDPLNHVVTARANLGLGLVPAQHKTGLVDGALAYPYVFETDIEWLVGKHHPFDVEAVYPLKAAND
jgi:hypothetical protein